MYAPQRILQIDAEIAKKDHFWMEISLRFQPFFNVFNIMLVKSPAQRTGL